MSSSDPRGWIDRSVDVCVRLLLGATALFVAVHLIESVWPVLLLIVGIGLIGGVAIGLLRARGRGW